MFNFLIGVDLGQARDYTAIVILQRREILAPEGLNVEQYNPALQAGVSIVNLFELRHIERPALGTSYPAIVDRLKIILSASELQTQLVVVVDQTGCGRPVLDMMRREGIGPLVGITVTGGATVQETEDGYHVPKKELVSALQIYLQSGRLKISSALPEAPTLRNEILNFRVKVRLKTGEESFEAWREGEHDDLVLATALPLWYAHLHDHPQPLADQAEAEAAVYDPLRWNL